MSDKHSGQPRIVIAEDEQVVALDLESQLGALGYQVVGLASTGPEVLDLVKTACPDLVLMDIQLHGAMDGIAAADEIRRRWHIPVVFLTAYANQELLARARAAGPYGYLTKPFRPNELNATVVIALHQHRLTREVFIEHGWLSTLLAGISDGVIATGIDGRVKYMNPVAESLTGWTLAEALEHPLEEVYPLRTESGQPVEQCQLRRVLASGRAISRQRFVLIARGGQITVDDSAAPIRNAENQLAGAVTVIVDVTEQQKREQECERLMRELERSNLELARFSHTVSHDLQTPVRTVKSFAQLLSSRLQPDPASEIGELLNHIQDAAGSMQRLVESLLRHAQAGNEDVCREVFSVAEAVNAVETILSSLIVETGTQIECGPLPNLYADRTQFEQLLQNLLSNAIRYRRPGVPPRISISAGPVNAGWQFAIADNGEGIAPEHTRGIFEPLKRLHGHEIPGSGVGLALCRAIVERHGGKIWAESRGPGCGSTFRFIIPKD